MREQHSIDANQRERGSDRHLLLGDPRLPHRCIYAWYSCPTGEASINWVQRSKMLSFDFDPITPCKTRSLRGNELTTLDAGIFKGTPALRSL